MGWYREIQPKRRRSDRVRDARKYGALGLRNRKPPKTRPPNFIFHNKYSYAFFLDGYKAKVTTKYRIAKFLDVPRVTVARWEKAGIFPEPLMVQERGNSVVNVYLAAQIRCFIMVVNQLVRHGYVTIPWGSLTEHLEMLQQGYDEVATNFRNRAMRQPYGGEPAERGVILYD